MENPQLEITKSNIAMMILAAGASIRMGVPKQLLPYQESNLLNHTIERAIASVCEPIIVVLGANAEQIHPQIDHLSVQIVENSQWHLGMSSSIRSGIVSLTTDFENIDAVVIAVCDQPFLSTQIINLLVATYYSTGKHIIASEYAGTYGVPALFSHKYFSELAALNQTLGAKQLIKKYFNEVFCVPFPQGAIDIDTPQEYEQLQTIILNQSST